MKIDWDVMMSDSDALMTEAELAKMVAKKRADEVTKSWWQRALWVALSLLAWWLW